MKRVTTKIAQVKIVKHKIKTIKKRYCSAKQNSLFTLFKIKYIKIVIRLGYFIFFIFLFFLENGAHY